LKNLQESKKSLEPGKEIAVENISSIMNKSNKEKTNTNNGQEEN